MENLKLGTIKLFPISCGSRNTILLPKPLAKATFLHLVSKLGLINVHHPGCEGVINIISL